VAGDIDFALKVSQAALMEVRSDPARIRVDFDHIRGDFSLWTRVDDPMVCRAIYLGYMSAFGADFMCRCATCIQRSKIVPPCTPVRDVLRGMTCGQ
jgi:hypothetical protein